MNTISHLAQAFRPVRRAPFFTAVVVATLGLGIGGATAVFSVSDAVLLRPLPYHDPGRLVHLMETTEVEPGDGRELSWPDFVDVRQMQGVFDGVAGYGYAGGFRIDGDDGPGRLDGATVTGDFFDVLGVAPVAGRAIRSEEEAPGSPRVAMLSHAYWTSRYGGREDAIGSTIRLEGLDVEIVGVVPADFHFAPAGTPDLWVAMVPSEMQRERRYMHWIKPVARLSDGVTIDEARLAASALARAFHEPDPTRGAPAIAIVPLAEQIVGKTRPVILPLLAAGLLALLIAIANVTGLIVARSTARQSEIATRVALGGTRARIVGQFLVEGLVFGALGAVAGIALARVTTSFLLDAIPDGIRATMPYLADAGRGAAPVAFAIVATLAATCAFGTVSALHAERIARTSVASGARVVATGNRMRAGLVTIEIALALALVVVSGLLLRSASAVVSADPGFDRRNLLTMEVELPRSHDDSPEGQVLKFDRIIERLEGREGVSSVALVSRMPLSGFGDTGTPTLAGRPEPGERVSANLRSISEGYFETMRIPTLDGRAFTRDDTAERPLVAVVSESLATKLLPGGRVIGERMRFNFIEGDIEIVGVAGDENVGALDAQPEPMVYFPYRQDGGGSLALVARTTVEPGRLAPILAADIRAIEPAALIHSVQSMEELIASSQALFRRQYPLKLIGGLGALALLLAAVGVFGVMAYSVALRRRELGIRVALGAGRLALFGQVLRHATLMGAVGIASGIAIAWPLTKLVSGLLFGVRSTDVATWLSAAAVIGVTSIVAALGPAWRASRTDASEALRETA